MNKYKFKTATTSTEASQGYYICRPPISKDYDLPTKEQLLEIEEGDFVQLIFGSSEIAGAEELWCKVVKLAGSYAYGELVGEPRNISNLKKGNLVSFYLGDVVKIMKDYRMEEANE